MKNIKKLLVTGGMLGVIMLGATATRAGVIIVGGKADQEKTGVIIVGGKTEQVNDGVIIVGGKAEDTDEGFLAYLLGLLVSD